MLVIKIELWPFGDESQKRDLGVARIINDGTGDANTGNYTVQLLKGAEYSRHPGDVYKRGRVLNYPRMLGPWPLLMRGIISALGLDRKERDSEETQRSQI